MPKTLIALIVYMLATYRLVILACRDKITVGIRDFIRDHGYHTMTGRALNGSETTNVTVINRFWSWLHDLISCEWCTSIWIATGVVVLQHYQQSWFQYICFGLALSSVASVMSEKT